MINRILVLSEIILLFISAPLSFADIVHMKDGAKIEGKFLEMDKDATVIDVGFGPLFLANWEIDHIEYINSDLGIKISCPPWWYMYTGKNLEKVFPLKSKIPITKWAVAFLKYPYRSVEDNPLIALEIQNMSFSKEQIKTPKEMAEMTTSYLRENTQNFKLIQSPKEIVVNGVKGVKYIMEYAAFESAANKQIICTFFIEELIIQIIATISSSEFTNDEKIIEECMNSLSFTGKKLPIQSESNLYKTIQAGTIYYEEENGLGYDLILKTKKNLPQGCYIEVKFPNPLFLDKPIIVSKEISNQNETIYFSSPFVKGIEPFKSYLIIVNTYESKNKKQLIDTLSQEIISFMRSPD